MSGLPTLSGALPAKNWMSKALVLSLVSDQAATIELSLKLRWR